MELIYSNQSKKEAARYTFNVYLNGNIYMATATIGYIKKTGAFTIHFNRTWRVEKFCDFLRCDFSRLKLAKIFLNSDFFKEYATERDKRALADRNHNQS